MYHPKGEVVLVVLKSCVEKLWLKSPNLKCLVLVYLTNGRAMRSTKLLMIFVRNPELGKVKTRLAKTVGAERALEIYKQLLKQTNAIAENVSADKAVFYSDFIDGHDLWRSDRFNKHLQEGHGLGERMSNAFAKGFTMGYRQVVVIGSDCYELESGCIDEAFYHLNSKDVAIGPSEDGGYYMLGMKAHHPRLFHNKAWGTENVFLDTFLDIKEMNLSYEILETLADVDFEEDLGDLRALID